MSANSLSIKKKCVENIASFCCAAANKEGWYGGNSTTNLGADKEGRRSALPLIAHAQRTLCATHSPSSSRLILSNNKKGKAQSHALMHVSIHQRTSLFERLSACPTMRKRNAFFAPHVNRRRQPRCCSPCVVIGALHLLAGRHLPSDAFSPLSHKN